MVQAAKTTSELEALTIWDTVTRLSTDLIVDVRIGVARLVASATGKSGMKEIAFTHNNHRTFIPKKRSSMEAHEDSFTLAGK
jgi:hypothetical protein